jgi:hypothetical protein
MFDLDQNIGDNDLDNTFLVEVDGGKLKITGYKTDPYGLWRVKFSAGSIPKDLQGAWTSRELARQAVDIYLVNRGKTVTDVKETSKDFKAA